VYAAPTYLIPLICCIVHSSHILDYPGICCIVCTAPTYMIPLICCLMALLGCVCIVLLIVWHNRSMTYLLANHRQATKLFQPEAKSNNDTTEMAGETTTIMRFHNSLYDDREEEAGGCGGREGKGGRRNSAPRGEGGGRSSGSSYTSSNNSPLSEFIEINLEKYERSPLRHSGRGDAATAARNMTISHSRQNAPPPPSPPTGWGIDSSLDRIKDINVKLSRTRPYTNRNVSDHVTV